MAFIPDDAEDRFHELSPSAERFYIYLCKTRNHKMQVSFGTIDACAQRYEWKRATKFAIVKELTSKGWIEADGSAWLLLVGDFSPVDKSKNLDSQSKKLDLESKNLDEQSKNLDSHIRNIPALPEIKPEQREKGASVNFVSPEIQAEIEETLFWIQRQKGIKSKRNFPENEWADLIVDVASEGIIGEGFRKFYEWVGNLDWVDTVSPKLLRGQIEKYIKRDEIAKKNGVNNGISKNTNGNRRNGSKAFKPADQQSDAETLARLGITA